MKIKRAVGPGGGSGTMHRRFVIAMLAVLLTASGIGVDAAVQGPATIPTPRLSRLALWIETMLQHQPGDIDDGIKTIGTWPNTDLRTAGIDVRVLVQLIRDPTRDRFSFKIQSESSAQPIRYTPDELRRLRQLACAVGGVYRQPECALLRISIEIDAGLKRLSTLASAVRTGDDDNFILRRGALLHADIAILGLSAPAASLATTTPASPQEFFFEIADGRGKNMLTSAVHWELGRILLDEVKPHGAPRPAPDQDAMVRDWYYATAAWMEYDGHHETDHLDRALKLFPDDAGLLFLAGSQHETYAGAQIQAAVRSAVLPTGITLAVSSERAELRQAERYLRRAVEADADLGEAHVRLGRVLALLGRPADAASELQKGLAATSDNLVVYYGVLFLGAVEETLGHDDAAKVSYQRAAMLYPLAQSPRLALSELARRSGDRDAALHAIEEVFALPSGVRDSDPWWIYHDVQAREADALLHELRRPFLREGEP